MASSSAHLRHPDPSAIADAATLLAGGGLVAFPTETVYGLGANASDAAAVARIFAAKGRPADNPLIVHLAAADDAGRVAAHVTTLARSLLERFAPGPLTLVLEARSSVPQITTGGLRTVAIRVPDHPVAAALLERADLPVAAPSANRSGRPSPTTAAHVLADLGPLVDLVLDGGACPVGVESTVVDARGPRPVVLREGSVTREELGMSADPADDRALAASPGTRYRHYAPSCEVVVAASGDAAATSARMAEAGRRVGLLADDDAPDGVVEVVRFGDAVELAQRLYDGLRRAEELGLEVVVVEQVPPEGVGRAVMDRVRRAAGELVADHR